MGAPRTLGWSRAHNIVNVLVLGALIAFVLWTTFVKP